MIRSTTRLKFCKQIKKKGKQLVRTLDISKLKDDYTRDELEATLNEKLTQNAGSVEEKWSSFRGTVYQVSSEVIGSVTRKHEDWFDENSSELKTLIENRNKARVDNLNRNTNTKAKLRHHNRVLQKRCRELKNQWWLNKAAELQILADTNNVKGFYQSMKAV